MAPTHDPIAPNATSLKLPLLVVKAPWPSSIAVLNLLTLSHLTGDGKSTERIERALSLFRAQDIVGLYVKVTLVASLFLSAPFVLAQAWLFISPGLYPHERRYAVPFVLFASVLFLAGGAFGYFIAFPTALRFMLAWIVESHLTPIIDFGEYLTLFLTIVVAFGLSFQIPAIVFVLSRIGLVDARFLAAKLKYAVFASVVAAAVLTPTTDPGNMLVLAGPMIVLYCVGIAVAWLFGRSRQDAPR